MGWTPKAKISISMDIDLIKWIDDQVRKGNYSSRSEAIEQIVRKARSQARQSMS